MSEHHVPRLSREGKRHAVLGDRPAQVLWVFDPADWQVMLDNDRALICPEPGCRVRLFPRPKSPTSKTVRHLWLGPKHGGGCEHWTNGSDGGLMTPRHLWVQTRILRTCRELGYTGVPEDQNTRADVFVADPATALEVQLRPTKFQERTETRRAKGADTIWFLSHDVLRTNKSVKDAIATLPTVRFKVVDTSIRNGKAPEFEPWTNPAELDDRADIQVYGTVFNLNTKAAPPRLEHAYLPMRDFLDEVLSGQRRWIPRGQDGMPTNQYGGYRCGWVRPIDLDVVREHHHKEEIPQPASPVPQRPAAAPSPEPVAASAPVEGPRESVRPTARERDSASQDLVGCFAMVAVVAVIVVIVWLVIALM